MMRLKYSAKFRYLTAVVILVSLSGLSAKAQKWSIGTNFIGWASLGTINAEAQMGLSSHITADVQVRVNPFVLWKDNWDKRIQNRHHTYFAGIKYWTSATYSKWWVRGGLQFQEYDRGGFDRIVKKEEFHAARGKAAGVVLGAGYSFNLTPVLSLDLGVDAWTGYDKSKKWKYEGQLITLRSRSGIFLLPNTVNLGLSCRF